MSKVSNPSLSAQSPSRAIVLDARRQCQAARIRVRAMLDAQGVTRRKPNHRTAAPAGSRSPRSWAARITP